MTTTNPVRWYEVHSNVAELCRYLVKEENWDVENILDLVEKPWHYDAEWAAYEDWQVNSNVGND